MKFFNRDASKLLFSASVLAAAAVALQGCGGTPYNANEQIGFPEAAGAMGTPDGLATDVGWSAGSTVRLEDGAPVAAGFIKTVRDTDNIYIYAEVADSSWDPTDALVLGLNPTNGTGDYRKLVIYPCVGQGGQTCSNGNSLTPNITSQTGTSPSGTSGWSAPVLGTVAGVDVKSVAIAGGWAVEMRINKVAFGIPDSNFFGLFVDAIATNPGGGFGGSPPFANNFSWPTGTRLSNASGTIDTANMQVPRWGNATLDPAKFATGLQITGLSTNGIDPSKISRTQPNKFYATVANNPMGSGAVPTVNNVVATFQLNNIGLNPNWTWENVPTTGNPTAGTPIANKEYKVLSPDPWSLKTTGTYSTSTKTELQFFTDNPHQCVRVQVRANGGSVVVAERQVNMDFVTVNSPFTSVEQIATGAWKKGFPSANRVYLNDQFYNVSEGLEWKSKFDGANQVAGHQWTIDKFEGSTQRLGVSVLASDKLQLPLDDYPIDVAALAKGETVDVKVEPGKAMTLLVDGDAAIGGRPLSPWGSAGDKKGGNADREPDYAKDVLRPGTMISDNALIGSFDGFETSFAIGTGTTLLVPANVDMMQVRLAGKGSEGLEGKWVMQAVLTDPTLMMLDGAFRGDVRENKRAILLPLGINLPMHIVRGTLDTGETIEIGGKRFNVTVPMGSFGHYIYRVNRGALFPRANPQPAQPVAGINDTVPTKRLDATGVDGVRSNNPN